jgi:hypothetical protein
LTGALFGARDNFGALGSDLNYHARPTWPGATRRALHLGMYTLFIGHKGAPDASVPQPLVRQKPCVSYLCPGAYRVRGSFLRTPARETTVYRLWDRDPRAPASKGGPSGVAGLR